MLSKFALSASARAAMVLPFLNSNLPARMLLARKLRIRSFSLTALKSPVPSARIRSALMNCLSVKLSF